MKNRLFLLAYWLMLGVVAAVGLGALFLRVTQGMGVSNLTSLIPWGLWVAFYIYFIGLSAGSFLISTMIYVFNIKQFAPIGRMALFTAFVALSTGLVFILLDLGHMERFYTVFLNRSSTSVLEWEIHFYNLYLVILLSELWLLMRRDLIRRSQEEGIVGLICKLLTFGSRDLSDESGQKDLQAVKILGLIGVPVAIGVHGGTGAIFAVVKARPYWNSGLFPLIFIVSALASGGALITFLYSFFGRKTDFHRDLSLALGKMTAGFLALDLVFLGSELLVGLYGAIPDHVAVYRAIMQGPFWYIFWIVQLGLGAVVPLGIILNKRTGNSVGWVGVASALIVLGIIGVRLNIVIPPFTVPLMPGVDTAYPLGRFATVDFSGLPGALFALAIVIFLVCAAYISISLARRVERPLERYLASGVGLAVMAGFLMMGLRFLGYSNPTATALLALDAQPASLPLFFGGMLRASDPAFYSPSAIEWLSSMGIIALAVMGFTLGWYLLPLQSDEAH